MVNADKKYFLVELIPPRPTFAFDLSDEENWRPHIDRGIVVVFGPVLGKSRSWGVAVVEAEGEATVRGIIENDPTIRSGRRFTFEISPIGPGFVRS
jgi:hypothetical protein